MQAMPASHLHRNTLGSGSRSPRAWHAWLLGTCVALAGPTQAEESPRTVVAPSEQLARDNDRIAILREELARSQAWLQTLERRKTERSDVMDEEGINDVEAQRRRTLDDIAALRRELASASRAADPIRRPRPAAPSAPGPAAAWWDVYGRSPSSAPSPPLPGRLAPETAQPVSAQVE